MFRISAAAVFAITAGVSLVSAENAHEWGFIDTKQDVRLFFGVPDSHEITLSLICEPRRKQLRIISTVLPPRATVGRAVTAKLSNGSASRDYRGAIKAEGRPDRIVFFEATTTPGDGLFDLLKAGSSLTIEVTSARESIPLQGVAAPLAQMEKACPGSR